MTTHPLKALVRKWMRRLGVTLCHRDRLGVDPDSDLQRLAAGTPIRCLFDAGGNFGQSALRYADSFPQATIYSFEPVPESFRHLQAAVRKQPRIRPIHAALGDAAGTATMHLAPVPGANSLLHPDGDAPHVEVPVDTIDAFVERHRLDTIDLLKIDVEGYELQVLRGARQTLGREGVRFIFAECVLPEDPLAPHTSLFDLHAFLAPLGFSFVAYYAEGFRLQDGCALGNVLYALRARLPDRVPGRFANIA